MPREQKQREASRMLSGQVLRGEGREIGGERAIDGGKERERGQVTVSEIINSCPRDSDLRRAHACSAQLSLPNDARENRLRVLADLPS